MALRIYINNCETGDYQIGCFVDKKGVYVRTLDKNEFGSIESFVDVVLKDNVPQTWSEVDKAVDDFFGKLDGISQDNQLYKKDVSNGTVELLAKGAWGKTADAIKQELRDAVQILENHGRKITLH